jgi:hypothetical protein
MAVHARWGWRDIAWLSTLRGVDERFLGDAHLLEQAQLWRGIDNHRH